MVSELFLVVSLVLVLAALFFFYYWYLKLTHYSLKDGIPGIQPKVFFGNIGDLGLLEGKSLWEGYQKMWHKFGYVWQVWVAHTRIICCGSVEAAETVYRNRQLFDSPASTRASFSLVAPSGLISLTGEDWKRHMHHLGPMFRRHRVIPFLPLVRRTGEEFVAKWRAMFAGRGAGDPKSLNVDVYNHLKNLTLDIFGRLAFDFDFECIKSMERAGATTAAKGGDKTRIKKPKPPANDLCSATSAVLDAFMKAVALPFPGWLNRLIFSLMPSLRKSKKLIRGHIQAAIDKRHRDAAEERGAQSNLLSAALSAMNQQDGLTAEEVMDELLLFVFGGHETTSSFLAWFVFLMAKHPEVQARLKQEIKKHLGGSEWTAEDLLQIEYLDNVWKECFRVAPITAGSGREATQDTVVDGHVVRKGDMVSVVVAVLHADPRNWKIDPAKFNPDRFSSDPAVGLDRSHHPYAFLPFGAGHRVCLGQELAKLETKALMAALMLQVSFHDSPSNTGAHVQSLTISPRDLAVFIQFDESSN